MRCVTFHSTRSVTAAVIGLSTLLFISGCAESSKPQTNPILDSLAKVEEAKKGFSEPVRAAAVPADSDIEDEAVPQTGSFTVRFETSVGDIVILVHRDWAPRGAHRFYQLVKDGFYDDCRFFRAISDFMVQFGINGDPEMHQQWQRNILDDPVRQSNIRSYVTFATAGANTRTTQVFINLINNSRLDRDGFAPFGEVIEGMSHVDLIFTGYGESPNQGQITAQGNAYLNQNFPDLDYIRRATIIEER